MEGLPIPGGMGFLLAIFVCLAIIAVVLLIISNGSASMLPPAGVNVV